MELEKTTEAKHKELLALLNPLIDFMVENKFNYFLIIGKDGTCTRHLRGEFGDITGMLTGMMENNKQIRGILEYSVNKMSDTTLNFNSDSVNSITTKNLWSNPERVDVIENSDSIEFIYKETSMISYSSFPAPPPQVRVFKIVFSCVDGKWNKSERIYGEIVPAENERYVF